MAGAFFGVAWGLLKLWSRQDKRASAVAARVQADIAALGEFVPQTVLPRIDTLSCIASTACIQACPEDKVIGIVKGAARLINPYSCVGHGACVDACPVKAIELFYGTEKRGIELPEIDASFESKLPGVYVVGELTGVGLIRNAIRQGVQAISAIQQGLEAEAASQGTACVDVVIVGAGPGGLGAALAAKAAGLRACVLEKGGFLESIAQFPRKKIVHTGAVELPLVGAWKTATMTKEALIQKLDELRVSQSLDIRTGASVSDLHAVEDGIWSLRDASGAELARGRRVVLALGRRGMPRQLEAPGANLPKVVYGLREPEVFRGEHVLVVGGGNSAVESAIALVEQGGCASVTLSYRKARFARLRAANQSKLEALAAAGTLSLRTPSEVCAVHSDRVELSRPEGQTEILPNDAVVVQIGGTAPTALLERLGVTVAVKHGRWGV